MSTAKLPSTPTLRAALRRRSLWLNDAYPGAEAFNAKLIETLREALRRGLLPREWLKESTPHARVWVIDFVGVENPTPHLEAVHRMLARCLILDVYPTGVEVVADLINQDCTPVGIGREAADNRTFLYAALFNERSLPHYRTLESPMPTPPPTPTPEPDAVDVPVAVPTLYITGWAATQGIQTARNATITTRGNAVIQQIGFPREVYLHPEQFCLTLAEALAARRTALQRKRTALLRQLAKVDAALAVGDADVPLHPWRQDPPTDEPSVPTTSPDAP